MPHSSLPALLLSGLLLIFPASQSQAADSAYRVLRKIAIGGEGGWDYLTADSQDRRLYVSHGKEMVVIDLESDKVVGRITGFEDVHGTAIAREFGRGFISASDPGSVTIFDLKTLAVLEKVRAGDDPNGIIYDPHTKRVFSADRGSKRLTAIDAKTGKIAGAVNDLGGRTEHLASDEKGHIFLNLQDKGLLLKIDAQALKVLETWSLAPCGLPSSMDMDREHERIFIGCRSGVMAVVDGNSGKVITTQPIGKGVDATEFDAGRHLIYFSTGEGTLSIFRQDSPDQYTRVEDVKTQNGARTMALDRKTGTAYLSVAEFGPQPEAAPGQPRPRPPILPGTFAVLVVGR